ncbi:hypothetical protein Tco_1079910 [Tanacetum coccineum]|uniref:Reverse transcriptase Ty1/copia-type domain-containing protein n=1 Tax=Tanacetum coccineum TaxID=301880 RepID=A0ABQ5HUQ9_9ASTR
MNYQPLRSENQANKHAGPKEANHNVVKSSKAMNTGEEPRKHPDLNIDEKPIDKEDQMNSEIPALEEIYDNPTAGIFTNASYDDEGAVADFTNLETIVTSPIPTSRINSIHPSTLILGDPKSKISEALEDESWVDAMQKKLLQFKIQKVLILVDLPYGKKAIGTKWVYRNKKDERGVVVRNKARIEDIRIFLAFYLFLWDFIVLSNGVKSASVWQTLMSVKTTSIPIETQKPLVKDEEASDVDVNLYRSMIGSLMYLTASRPDIMFAVCACSRVSSFDLEAYLDSNYAGANLDRKSTTGEAEYVAAANCCGQVLWIQNQMLDYGFNFMNTKIYIDNESTICIVKNPVFHSKTKHIVIRHHLIRDAYEKKVIQVLKIHTDDNVADLLTNAFDVSRFQFLVVTIGMINP